MQDASVSSHVEWAIPSLAPSGHVLANEVTAIRLLDAFVADRQIVSSSSCREVLQSLGLFAEENILCII